MTEEEERVVAQAEDRVLSDMFDEVFLRMFEEYGRRASEMGSPLCPRDFLFYLTVKTIMMARGLELSEEQFVAGVRVLYRGTYAARGEEVES